MEQGKQTTRYPPANKPLMVWDGDCDFCYYWVQRWKKMTGDKIDFAPYQEVGQSFKDIPETTFKDSVVLVEPDGAYYHNAAAPLRSFTYGTSLGWLYSLYEKSDAFATVSDNIYRLIALNRPALMKATEASFGKNPAKPKPFWLLYLAGLGGVALGVWFAVRKK